MIVARHGLRRAARLAGAPFRALRPGGGLRMPERLVVAPQDLRTTDPTVANDIYAGYYAFAGKVVPVGGASPFRVEPPSEAWSEALMGFGWLRHLRAADSALARANARALVNDWINERGRPHASAAWKPEVVSRRLMSWLTQSPLILEGSDRAFYRRFLRSVGRQAGWLSSTMGDWPENEARLNAAIALAYAALCTGAPPAQLRRISRLLAEALDRQILPDGGHVGRNPQTIVDLLTDLLPLRQTYASQGVEPPRALMNAIDRMMPALKLFRHGDGSLALFNGMSVSPPDRLATLLAYNDSRVQAIENAPHSGYQRLQARQAVVIMDAGPPPPARGVRQGPCGLPLLRVLGRGRSHRRQLRRAAPRQRAMAPDGARHRRPFHRDARRHLVLPLRHDRARRGGVDAHHRRSDGGDDGARGAAQRGRRRTGRHRGA